MRHARRREVVHVGVVAAVVAAIDAGAGVAALLAGKVARAGARHQVPRGGTDAGTGASCQGVVWRVFCLFVRLSNCCSGLVYEIVSEFSSCHQCYDELKPMLQKRL